MEFLSASHTIMIPAHSRWDKAPSPGPTGPHPRTRHRPQCRSAPHRTAPLRGSAAIPRRGHRSSQGLRVGHHETQHAPNTCGCRRHRGERLNRLKRGAPFGGSADVVAVGGPTVLRAGWASGTGSSGFRRAGRSDVFARRFRSPRRTRAGVSRPAGAGRSHGRRRSAIARGEVRSLGTVQPRVCLKNLNLYSRPKRHKNICHNRSTYADDAPTREDHNHNGLGSLSLGRWSTTRRIKVPSNTGRSPS